MSPAIDPTLPSKHSLHDLPTPEPESPVRRRKQHKFSTLCATVEHPGQKDQYGSSSVPIYQTATFKGTNGEYDYSRSGNPTRTHLQHHIAKISSAAHAFAVSSGMAALDVILRILKPGDEVIAGDDIYGGTHRLLTYLTVHGGVIVHNVDTTNPDLIRPIITRKTAMVLLESPTNPLLKIADIALISKDVKEAAPDAIVVVDNTMMSPYLQRPLEHGADIVYDSATKYLSGHHDLMAGAITCNRDDLAKQMAHIINSIGNALTPGDSFLLLRGIKTLAVRMDRQQANAQQVANYLHSIGFTVHYPGLPSHPGREIHQRIAHGSGAVLSFGTGNKELSERIVGGTRLWGISVSFGCVNSLISMPCVMSHASIDPATRAARGLPEDLIRLCVGIEDASDLIEDLEYALLEAGAITFSTTENKMVRSSPAIDAALRDAMQKLATDAEPSTTEWFVSAPGKIILFGEHAVVHGVTAIAASVDLRCYGIGSLRDDGKISVYFHDIDSFSHSWDISQLPWDHVTPVAPDAKHPDSLDQKLVEALENGPLHHLALDKPHAKAACLAFLYVYMSLSAGGSRPSFNFSARSTLPIGAGLGSSASFSACAATTILLFHQRIEAPPLPPPSSNEHLHFSHQGRRAIPPSTAEEINHWAFIAEKVLHGNPSGVDNSVAVFGGALAYTRPGFTRKSGMEQVQGFKSFRFLLTNSKVPRDTKKLVASVGQRKLENPEEVNKLLDAIQSISDEGRRALADPEMSRKDLITAISALMRENHQHLVSLGVSHSSLELIRERSASEPYSLSTKLTGAGGGGCAVTLIPDDFSDEYLQSLIQELSEASFDPYVTSVGGSGLGILSPYPQHRNPSVNSQKLAQSVEQITPPETPNVAGSGLGPDLALLPVFDSITKQELPDWAIDLGRWLYV